MRVENGPWWGEHSGAVDERLMDIHHLEHEGPVDGQMLDVSWDGTVGRYSREISEADMQETLDEWVRDHGAEYRAELPYMP